MSVCCNLLDEDLRTDGLKIRGTGPDLSFGYASLTGFDRMAAFGLLGRGRPTFDTNRL